MRGSYIKYTRKQLAWLKRHAKSTRRDAYRKFVKHFRRKDVTFDNIKALYTRKRWKTGRTGCYSKGNVPANKGKKMPYNANTARTQFKKGQVPQNAKPVGHERICTKDGYIMMSVAMRNPHTGANRHYVMKHKHLWEKKNGKVPAGMRLKSRDGNRQNCDPDNWILLPMSMALRLNGIHGRDYDNAPADLKPVILATAMLADKMKERKRT